MYRSREVACRVGSLDSLWLAGHPRNDCHCCIVRHPANGYTSEGRAATCRKMVNCNRPTGPMTLHLPRDRMPRPARSHAAPRGAVQRDPAHLTPRCEWRLVCGQISPPDSWFCVFSTSESRPTRYIGSSCANWLLRASTASGDSSGHCTGHKSVSAIWPQAKSDDVAPVVRHSAKCLAFLSKLYQVLCAIPIERSSRLELLHCGGAPATAAHFAHSTFVRPCSDWPKAPAQRTLCARLRAGASPHATS